MTNVADFSLGPSGIDHWPEETNLINAPGPIATTLGGGNSIRLLSQVENKKVTIAFI
jgi:hypothetical protein